MKATEQKNIESTVTATSGEIFADKLKKFNSFYFQLVVLCAVVAAATIAVSIIASALIGIAVAIALALIYLYFSRDELKRSLGIGFAIKGASISIRELSMVIGSDGFIPSRLMWYDVTEISSSILNNKKAGELKCLHIPKTVTRIEKGAFDGCRSLKVLAFEHSESEFANLDIEADLSSFTLEFCVPFPYANDSGGAK